MKNPHFPDVTISTPANDARGAALHGSRAVQAASTKLALDGLDLSDAVVSFRVGGEVKGAIELELTLLCGNVSWTQH